MNQELPPGQAADEIQALSQIVSNSLANGEDPEKVAQQLIDSGWEPDQAQHFVNSIHHQMHEEQRPQRTAAQRSESMGWLVWIGAIVGINLLSWLFDWGFWIY
ncbi:MAG: hypothetical protein AAGG48_02080 [Planctomycetota bacterium]